MVRVPTEEKTFCELKLMIVILKTYHKEYSREMTFDEFREASISGSNIVTRCTKTPRKQYVYEEFFLVSAFISLLALGFYEL